MGEGNVRIEEYVRKFAALCPGRALSMETIVTGPRVFAYRDPVGFARLIDALENHDAVVAHDGERRQPLFALYSRKLAASAGG